MFSFHRRNRDQAPETVSTAAVPETDPALIAVLAAAIARFRESEGSAHSDTGFVVRRVRRV